MDMLLNFLQQGAFFNFSWGNLVMLLAGCGFLFLALTKGYEPLLLVPIGFGILILAASGFGWIEWRSI